MFGIPWPWLLGGVATLVAVDQMTRAKPSSPAPAYQRDWSKVRKLSRVYPPPAPFYAPSIHDAKIPLVFFTNGFLPSNNPAINLAIDASGRPWLPARLEYTSGSPLAPEKTIAIDQYKALYGGEFWNLDAREFQPVKVGDYVWTVWGWSDGPSIAEKVEAAVDTIVVPALITIAGGLIGGPGGAAVAFALEAGYKMARGGKFTDAVKDAYRDRLEGEVQKNAYYQAFEKVVGDAKSTKKQIETYRDQLVATYRGAVGKDSVGSLQAAVDAGIAMARAKQLQSVLLYAVQRRISVDEYNGLGFCRDHNVPLADWLVAMYGTSMNDFMAWATKVGSDALDAGRDPMAAVAPSFNMGLVEAIGRSFQ